MSQHGYPERLSRNAKAYPEDGFCPPTIEVLVETLTGTAFEMTVSPLDTILAIKSKIFRVEGIPISHQHLLYNLKELDDSSSLRDYSIKDGSTLRLVLSMRGGPISTRRLPLPSVDDIHWRDIKDFVESNKEEAFEWLPSGCKVTVLVFGDGEQVNLIRVKDNEDGTYSPINDDNCSLKSLLDDVAADKVPGVLQENAVTMGKMVELRRRMENLSMQKHKKPTNGYKEEDNNVRCSEQQSQNLNEDTLININNMYDDTPNFITYKGNHLRNIIDPSQFASQSQSKLDYDCSFSDRYTLLPAIHSYSDTSQESSDVSPPSTSCDWHYDTTDFYNNRKFECAYKYDKLPEPNSSSVLFNIPNALPIANIVKSGNDKETQSLSEETILLNRNIIGQDLFSKGKNLLTTVELRESEATKFPVMMPRTAPISGSDYATHVTQLLEEETDVPSTSFATERYDNCKPLRKVIFGSNSHLNSLVNLRNISKDNLDNKSLQGDSLDSSINDVHTGNIGPISSAHVGSEPQLNKLHKMGFLPSKNKKKYFKLSHSVSNLYFNSYLNNKYSCFPEFYSNNNLDKAQTVTHENTFPAISNNNMVFSSSTSDLETLKSNKILPSLSRHRNLEHLDVSDECLDSITVTNGQHKEFINQIDNIDCDDKGSVEVSIDPQSSDTLHSKTLLLKTTNAPIQNNFHAKLGSNINNGNVAADKLKNPYFVRNIQRIIKHELPEDVKSASSSQNYINRNKVFLRPNRNLEVGSERKCKRVKKIAKLENIVANEGAGAPKPCLFRFNNSGYQSAIHKLSNETYKHDTHVNQSSSIFEKRDVGSIMRNKFIKDTNFSLSSPVLDSFKKEQQFSKDLRLNVLSSDVKSRIKPKVETIILPEIVTHNVVGPPIIPQNKKNRVRCGLCNKRLTIATIHTCRCGVIFCAPHRYAEVHGCAYDYKTEGQTYLQQANPLVNAPKLPKI